MATFAPVLSASGSLLIDEKPEPEFREFMRTTHEFETD